MTEGKEVEVNFIVVNTFSLYTVILGRSWILVMEVAPSTLHQKIKFLFENGVAVVYADQRAVRQYLVPVVNHEIKQKDQVEVERL